MKLVRGFDQLLEKISRYGLISCFFAMLMFSVIAIVFRWIGQSIMWVDPLIRHMVFASAFFGGSLATSKNVHINVDVLTRLLERSKSKFLHWFVRNLVRIFCLLVCLGLTKAGWDFYLSEKEFGAPAFLEIHSAYLVGIIWMGMGLVSLRYLNLLLIGLFNGEKIESPRL